jgi:membrane protein DedA with SNARE-associated domain
MLLRRHHLPFILSVRFLYGLRIAGPIAIGMARVPWLRFLALNAIGAAIWAIVIGGAGYFFGAALESALTDLRSHERWILAAILVVGLCIALAARICRRSSLPSLVSGERENES